MSNIDTICNQTMSSPKLSNRVAASWIFERPGTFSLNPKSGPKIMINDKGATLCAQAPGSGRGGADLEKSNCAIAIGFVTAIVISWLMLKSAMDYLLERCFGSPVAPQMGWRFTRQVLFSGPPTSTCACGHNCKSHRGHNSGVLD